MRKQLHTSHRPEEIEGFDSLAGIALDMHWAWNDVTDEVWPRPASMALRSHWETNAYCGSDNVFDKNNRMKKGTDIIHETR